MMKKLQNLLKLITLFSLPALFIYSFYKLPKVVSSAGSGVVINEVAWGGTSADTNDEWIELYNSSGTEVDLTDWTLVATDGSPSITLSGTVPAGGYFLLERSDDNTVKDITANQFYTGALSNTGESLELRNELAELEDSANTNGGAWPAGTSSPAQSMERVDPLLPDTDDNWTTNDSVTIIGTDVGDGPVLGTPKSQNSVYGVTPTPTDEPTPTEEPTESPTPTEEPSATPTDEPLPTVEPSPSPTDEPTPTVEPTPSPEPTPMSKVFWRFGFGSSSVVCKPVFNEVRFGFFHFRMMSVVCN